MTDEQLRIVVGGLLHDVGKILYRSVDGRNHSESGYYFLKQEALMDDQKILDQIRYHHAKQLCNAKLGKKSLAYITYIADNIASAMDRRKKEDGQSGFVKDIPLESIFNILNGNQESMCYQPMMLDAEEIINYPTEKAITYSEGFYAGIKEKIKSCLMDFEWKDEYISSLLSILEATMSFLPSSTSREERADVSLYDHVKMTAAIGSCIYEYATEYEINDFNSSFFKNASSFYSKKAFLIYSMDISGIQDFIYTISSKGALKGLRSRSFYLEIMMEHMIDELLFRLSLSRANLLYSGGGHAYLLIANTKKTKEIVQLFEKEMNQWFLDTFQIALYVGCGMAECSSNDLCNQPDGSYREIFQTISKHISEKKRCRYTKEQLIALNKKTVTNGERECIICRRNDRLRDENKCEICDALEKMSKNILYGKFFTVIGQKEDICVPLPGGCYLVCDTEEKLRERMEKDEFYIRAYSKNKMYVGYSLATKLWVGDYVNGDTFEELGSQAEGIHKIAVMRADVDNLGQAFVRGFESETRGNDYVTLSRTSTFSRKMSMFFKYHINHLLEHGTYMITSRESGKRNALIVYSGGDDVFVVGSWDDVIGFAIDLYYSLKKYTQATLSISAGIGIYPTKYPISVMAQETGILEESSKELEGKNAVTLFHKDYTFHWEELIKNVIEEKLQLLKEFFIEFDERGKNFLYNILDLLRNRDDRINIARYAYLLGKICPKEKERQEGYQRFSQKMYQWMRNNKDAKELEMAIYLYVYMKRTKEEQKDGIE